MSIDKHVVSLDIAKQLVEAGIKVESEFVWMQCEEENEFDVMQTRKAMKMRESDGERDDTGELHLYYPSYLASELGELLPLDVFCGKKVTTSTPDPDSPPYVLFDCWNNGIGGGEVWADTMPNAMAKLLIYLKNEGLI